MTSSIKLDFSSIELCGRTDELRTLQNVFEDASRRSEGKDIAIVGESGTGKTALIDAFQRTVETKCFFCRGKCEKETAAQQPFGALASCLKDLTAHLMNDDTDLWKKRIDDHVPKCVGQFMARLVPSMRTTLIDWNDESAGEDATGGMVAERLKVALTTFLTIISNFHPVVIVMDDFHWADRQSLALMQSNESECVHGYVFVGSFRKVGPEDPFHVVMNSLISSVHTLIQLSDFSIDQVSAMVQKLLRRDREDVQSLVNVVHQKTGGNVLFVVQFLSKLERQHLIFYSTSSYRFEWDTDRIISETDVSENVVDVVAAKIKTLPQDAQMVLTTAASLGPSHFDLDTLFSAVQATRFCWAVPLKEEKVSQCIQTDRELEDLLDLAVIEGLVEKLKSSTSFKFAHDRIQEAAYGLLPEGDAKKRLHFRVGKELQYRLSTLPSNLKGTVVEDRLVLLSAHQLRLGSEFLQDKADRAEVACLNLRASDLALAQLAFVTASDYLSAAIELLSSSWDEHYDIMLELSTKLAKTYLCCGLHEQCEDVIDDMLKNARSFRDKIPAYDVLVSCRKFQGRLKEAFEIVFLTLDELGFPIPRRARFAHLFASCFLVKRLLRSKTDDHLLCLAETDRPEVISAVVFLRHCLQLSSISNNPVCRGLSLLQTLTITLEHGSNEMTGASYVMYALTRQSSGDFDGASRYGNLALQVSEQHQAGWCDGLTLLLHHIMIHHWRNPYHDSLEPTLRAYRIFSQSTEAEFSFIEFSICSYAQLYLCCGLRLSPLEVDLRKFADVMDGLGQTSTTVKFRPWWQFAMNLMGKSEDPLMLTGDAMNQEQLVKRLSQEENSAAIEIITLCRMILAYHFGELELAAELASKNWAVFSNNPFPMQPLRLFVEGLVNTTMAKSTRKLKYRIRARSILRQFENWLAKGAVNCHHMLLLLRAENFAQKDKTEVVVQEAFDDAISAAAKLGFTHHHALANELAGVYFLNNGDQAWSRTYLSRARELYADWGASAKVCQMEEKYNWCFADSSVEPPKTGSLRARSRIDELSQRSDNAAVNLSLHTFTSKKIQGNNPSNSVNGD